MATKFNQLATGETQWLGKESLGKESAGRIAIILALISFGQFGQLIPTSGLTPDNLLYTFIPDPVAVDALYTFTPCFMGYLVFQITQILLTKLGDWTQSQPDLLIDSDKISQLKKREQTQGSN